MFSPQQPPDSTFVSSGAEARQFECVLSHGGQDAVWIRLAGELDLATVPQLERALYEALANAQLIVIDLRELTFIDSTGLHALIAAANAVRGDDQRLVLIRGPESVDFLIRLVGIADRLEILDPGTEGSRPAPSPRHARMDAI